MDGDSFVDFKIEEIDRFHWSPLGQLQRCFYGKTNVSCCGKDDLALYRVSRQPLEFVHLQDISPPPFLPCSICRLDS